MGKDARRRVWEKLMAARVVYLGEAELVPDRDDRVLELEIVRKLAAGCAEAGRSISLALEAFPCDLQEQLNQFMDGRYLQFVLNTMNLTILQVVTSIGEQHYRIEFLAARCDVAVASLISIDVEKSENGLWLEAKTVAMLGL